MSGQRGEGLFGVCACVGGVYTCVACRDRRFLLRLSSLFFPPFAADSRGFKPPGLGGGGEGASTCSGGLLLCGASAWGRGVGAEPGLCWGWPGSARLGSARPGRPMPLTAALGPGGGGR